MILLIIFSFISLYDCQVQSHAFRLHPNQDLTVELNNYMKKNQLQAVSISTVVGSLLHCSLRFANQTYLTRLEGPFEIVSLVGTFSVNGQHLHIVLSDQFGRTFGGHLPSPDERIEDSDDCSIYTTAEVILLEHKQYFFKREIDRETGYDELVIYQQ